MGAKAKKALKQKLGKAVKKLSARREKESSDYLSLDVGAPQKPPPLEQEEAVKDVATVLYIGHIPHGFYEDQMEGFFKQFGKIRRLRIARNKKTGKSKHYGFLQFENPEVARVVADEIHGYHLFEHILQIHLIPPERVHPKLWKGINRRYKPIDLRAIAMEQQNKVRSPEENEKLVLRILKRDKKKRARIEEAGIDYECPEFVGGGRFARKRAKLNEGDE